MNDDLRITREYLTAPQGAFWSWQERGEVLTWADGKTIVFREELRHVLARLAPRGLPPFGSVALLLAATRDNWGEAPSESGILAGCLRCAVGTEDQSGILNDVIVGLERVHRLDRDLRTHPEAKAALAEIVFEGARERTSGPAADTVVENLRRGIGEVLDALQFLFNVFQELDNTFALQFVRLHAGLVERVNVDQFRVDCNGPFIECNYHSQAEFTDVQFFLADCFCH